MPAIRFASAPDDPQASIGHDPRTFDPARRPRFPACGIGPSTRRASSACGGVFTWHCAQGSPPRRFSFVSTAGLLARPRTRWPRPWRRGPRPRSATCFHASGPSRAMPPTGNTSSFPATTSSRRARGHAAAAPSGRGDPGYSRSNARHEQRRRGDGVGVRLTQPLEAGPELLVVHGQLAVEHERARRELRDGGREISEPPRVVAPVAAQQADADRVSVSRSEG
jgi:hypothetical protein